MLIAIVDGMGGGLGAQLAAQLACHVKDKAEVIVLGTNALATGNMIKAGGFKGATGENAVKVSLRYADIVVGPIGIVIPNALLGEITPAIAEAVMLSPARKILIPVSQNHVDIVGIENQPLVNFIKEAIARICREVEKENSG